MSYSHNPYDFDPRDPQRQAGPQDQPPLAGVGPVPPQPYGGPHPGRPMPYPPFAPYGADPLTGEPYSEKSKLAAGLLQIFLGEFGVGRFYMGTTGVAVAQLVLTLVGLATTVILVGFVILFGVGVWALVDGILILAGRPRDGAGRLLRP